MLSKTTSVEMPTWCTTANSSGAGIKRTMSKSNAQALEMVTVCTSAWTFKMDGSGETNTSGQMERVTILVLQV